MAKVYRCEAGGRGPRNWNPATKAGALLFLRDAEQDENMFLRLVDIDNAGRNGAELHVLWEHEMWIGFEWVRSDQSYFYTFESDVPKILHSTYILSEIGLCVWSYVQRRA